VYKIHVALQNYESEFVDRWIIDFLVGENYDSYTEEQIQDAHQKLVSSGASAEQVKLLTLAERGRLYDFLKFSEKWNRKWEELCRILDVCSRTANRYIDFSKIVAAYPRILICGLSFETIMSLYKELQNYLAVTQDLALKLASLLRSTKIEGCQTMFNQERLPGGGTAPVDLLSENADWRAAWQISDEIIESQEEAEYAESQEEAEYVESQEGSEYDNDDDHN